MKHGEEERWGNLILLLSMLMIYLSRGDNFQDLGFIPSIALKNNKNPSHQNIPSFFFLHCCLPEPES